MGELDLDLRPAGADATEADPVGNTGENLEVISLMLEAAPVVKFVMLPTGSTVESTTSSSFDNKIGIRKSPDSFGKLGCSCCKCVQGASIMKARTRTFTIPGSKVEKGGKIKFVISLVFLDILFVNSFPSSQRGY